MRICIHVILITFTTFVPLWGVTQTSEETIIIDDIVIIGNKRTRDATILRELSVIPQSKIKLSELVNAIEADKQKLLNTRLFLSAELQSKEVVPGHHILEVTVKERWYLWPVPIFEFADRNLNDWLFNQDADFSRLQYGIKLFENNLTGRGDRLKTNLQFGFTRKFEIEYSLANLTRKQNLGFSVEASFIENNTVAFNSENNRQQFAEGDRPLRTRFRTGIRLTRRSNFYSFHSVSLTYHNNQIDDTLRLLNPNYFLNGETQQQNLTLEYKYTLDRRSSVAYPLTGYIFEGSFRQIGLGIFDDISQTEFFARFSKFYDLGKGFYFAHGLSGKISGPQNQPYFNFRGLGFEEQFIRGYELFVIEGQHYALQRLSLRKKLLSKEYNISKVIPVSQFNTIPIALYPKVFFDTGIVGRRGPLSDQTATLSNNILWGLGAGLDFVTYYDLVFRFEYSLNSEGDTGFFIHFKTDI